MLSGYFDNPHLGATAYRYALFFYIIRYGSGYVKQKFRDCTATPHLCPLGTRLLQFCTQEQKCGAVDMESVKKISYDHCVRGIRILPHSI